MKVIKMLFVTLALFGFLLFSCEKENTLGTNTNVLDDKSLETRQKVHVNGGGWSICEVSDLKIYVSECINEENEPTWYYGITQAIQNFNNIDGSAIHFEFVENESDADIVIGCYSEPNDCSGGHTGQTGLELPLYGFANYVEFNIDFDLANCGCERAGFDGCTAISLVMHELSHALGFFHNESVHPNAVLVDGTPEEDSESVINGANNSNPCNLPCEFSSWDILAFQTVYPTPEILGADTICTNNMYKYCVGLGANETIYWNLPNSIQGMDKNCVEIISYSPGELTLSATIYEDDCEYTVEKIVHVQQTCELPDIPPSQFENICMEDDEICYDFSNVGCDNVTFEVHSSSPKLLVEVNETEICLKSIFPLYENVVLSVTPVGICGKGQTQYWNITMNDPRYCFRGSGK